MASGDDHEFTKYSEVRHISDWTDAFKLDLKELIIIHGSPLPFPSSPSINTNVPGVDLAIHSSPPLVLPLLPPFVFLKT